MLTSETVITGDDIGKLFRHNIDYVDICIRNNFETDAVINPQYELIISNILPKFEAVTNGIKNLFDQVRAEGKIDERIVHQNIDPLLEQLHPMSRIISVADVYSAMISSRVYQKKKDLLFVLRELHKLSFTELDPHIVHSFIRKMIPNFIGKNLVMKSGEVGQIIMTKNNSQETELLGVILCL